ncbi:Uu.00g003690.m01.CDS01 [Anthostomella pinea]|uniref:Uu.00g003690.m01.CDS01 n=1 Tax=Anthostomella pinea TaxID=933095 RepID=A0AAI8YGB6_9PEZI|nr:Uu.00g003690.m01.CDS01 [Anthostomella pinea]
MTPFMESFKSEEQYGRPLTLMGLPLEIREMIWEEALPRRVISADHNESTFLPGPPSIAQVCRESRAFAIRSGSPRTFDHVDGSPRGTWFDASRDVVLGNHGPCSCPPSPVPQGRPEPRCRCFWSSLRSITLQSNWLDSRPLERFTFKDRLDNEPRRPLRPLSSIMLTALGWRHKTHKYSKLQKINIFPAQDCLRDFYPKNSFPYWPREVLDLLFENNTIRLVDLRDAHEVAGVVSTLSAHYWSEPCGRFIQRAHEAVVDKRWNRWEETVHDLKHEWLTSSYYRGRADDVLARVLVNHRYEDWDVNDPWIKEALAKMPEICPVYPLINYDEKDWRSGTREDEGGRRQKVERMVVRDGEAWTWAAPEVHTEDDGNQEQRESDQGSDTDVPPQPEVIQTRVEHRHRIKRQL